MNTLKMSLNNHNQYRIKLAELISWTNIVDLEVNEVITKLNEIFSEEKYPWINLDIKNKLRENISFPFENSSELAPETFLSLIKHSWNIDFENSWLDISDTALKDIPIQYQESLKANVETEFNWTIWVLVDENWLIAINPEVKKILQDNLWLKLDEETINNLVKYHSGDWLALFQTVYEKLIEKEQERYSWEDMKWTATKPFFIAWWSSWLTVFRDYFLDEWTLVIVPNYRWPNIDWIVMNKTKVSPAVADIFDESWNINFDGVDDILSVAEEQWRKKVWIYLNFPNNPTWLNFWQEEANKLNSILSRHPNLEINIAIDDPYWVFALKENLDVKTPISYLIDTENNKNITLLELWSHWTKEAWVYWFRTAVMRWITHEWNKENLEKKLSLGIRQTFSMSSSLPQVILLKAILWKELEVFAKDINLSEKEVNEKINTYLEWRKEMSSQIFDRINSFRKSIEEEIWEYFNTMWWEIEWTNWFYLTFLLSEYWKEEWIIPEELRKICINNTDTEWNSKKCSFSVFEDTISWEQCMRISLISWDIKEYAKRLWLWIDKLVNT